MTPTASDKVVATALVVVVGFFLLAPLAVVIVFAFHSSPRLALPYEGVSLRWFRSVASDGSLSGAFVTSVQVAALVGVLSAVVGFLGAHALLARSRAMRVLALVSSVPSLFPPLLLALGLGVLLREVGATQGMGATVMGQLLIALPFTTLVIYARLRSLDPAYAQASRDLGASHFTTFRRVTLPLVRNSLIAGACLAMALSLDEFVIAYFVGGASPTVPVVLWGLLRSGVDPTANALAAGVLILCSALVALALAQLGRDVEEL